MALQKQLVALPLDQGLDTKFDIKQQAPGYLRAAENVVYETIKLLKKRNGYDLTDLYDTDNNPVIDGRLLTKLKEELVLLATNKLYTFSQTLQKLVERGTLYSTSLKTSPVIKNANSQTEIDAIYAENFKVYVWRDSSGGVRYSVQDLQAGSFVISDGIISANGEKPVLARLQNFIYVIYGEGADIVFRQFSVLSPQNLSAPTVVISNRDLVNGLIDAESSSDRVAVAYNSTAPGAELAIFTINQNNTTSSIIGVTGAEASMALDITTDEQSRILVTYSNGSEIGYTIYPFTLATAILTPTTIETIPNVKTCSLIEANGGYEVFYEVEQAGESNNYVNTASVDLLGNVTNIQVFMRSVGLAARAFLYNSEIMIPVVHESSLQSTYYLVNESGRLITKWASQIADGVVEYGVLQQVTAIDQNQYFSAFLVRNRLQAENGTFYSTSGVISATINFQPENYYSNAQLADALHICAGILKIFDGATVSEHGFLVFPEVLELSPVQVTTNIETTVVGVTGITSEVQVLTFSSVPGSGSFTLTYGVDTTAAIPYTANAAAVKAAIDAIPYMTSPVTVTGDFAVGFTITYDDAMGDVLQPTITNSLSTPTTGGELSNGNYSYVAVYRWTDNTGKDHRSAPTQLALDVILSGGGSTQQAVIRVPTLRITEKENVAIELYRTENNGSTYYLVTDELQPVLNNKTVDYIDITDGLSDAELISQEVLYTTGGVIENIAAPAANQITVYNNTRLAVIGEDANRVYFSKQISEGFPVEFTDLIYRDVNPVGGALSTIQGMDDKLIIYSKDACFFMSGEGPNNLGQQDSFTQPEIIATDIGCTEPRGTVLTPPGIMFKSRKGIWRLTRGLALEYIGARVEAYNLQVVNSADVVGELNQVRFVLAQDRALVYNYNLDRWATFENHGGLSSVTILNDYYYLREDGALFKENRQSFSDATSPIKFKIETGWLTLAELQGFQRVYHAMILATYKSNHKLRVKVAYDFIDAWVQEKTINPLDFIEGTTYGEVSPYGADPLYGGANNLYQVRLDFMRQKCTAIKLSIEDLQETVGEGLSLSGVTLRAGAKEGANKLGQSNKFGTST